MARPVSQKSTVYVATNFVNGAEYIGVTCQYLSQRKSRHFRSALREGSQTHFHRAIRKHGKHSFVFSVHSQFDCYEEAKAAEVALIATRSPKYNMTLGGDGARGYKHTPAVVAEIRRRNKGQPGYWKGKKLPPHVGALSAERNRNSHHKARVLALGPKSTQKRVVCLDDGRSFESISAAAKFYRIAPSQISSVCNRDPIRVTARGLVFRFEGDHHGGMVEADAIRQDAHNRRFRPGQKRLSKPVIHIEDGLTFDSVKSAAMHYGITTNRVIKSCRNRYKYRASERLKFSYIDDTAAGVSR